MGSTQPRSIPQKHHSTIQQPPTWNGHMAPFGSSEGSGSPPSMINVPSLLSSNSDDISAISSPESYQYVQVNRKRSGQFGPLNTITFIGFIAANEHLDLEGKLR